MKVILFFAAIFSMTLSTVSYGALSGAWVQDVEDKVKNLKTDFADYPELALGFQNLLYTHALKLSQDPKLGIPSTLMVLSKEGGPLIDGTMKKLNTALGVQSLNLRLADYAQLDRNAAIASLVNKLGTALKSHPTDLYLSIELIHPNSPLASREEALLRVLYDFIREPRFGFEGSSYSTNRVNLILFAQVHSVPTEESPSRKDLHTALENEGYSPALVARMAAIVRANKHCSEWLTKN